MNVTMKERQLECAEHSLLAATDLEQIPTDFTHSLRA
jgi:hypothetical protein